MTTITLKDGVEIEKNVKKKVLHNIILLDASGSMAHRGGLRTGPSKYEAAIDAINLEIQELKKSNDADIRFTVYEFDSQKAGTERITEHCFATPIAKLGKIVGRGPGMNTPLYQSIAYVIEKFLRTAGNDEQVLIKIFTDAAHNCTWGKYGTEKACRDLIKDVEEKRNFTTTFVGTERDTQFMVDNLGIDASNTLSYDGTADGLYESMSRGIGQTVCYAANVSKGIAKTKGFYKPEEQVGKTEVKK